MGANLYLEANLGSHFLLRIFLPKKLGHQLICPKFCINQGSPTAKTQEGGWGDDTAWASVHKKTSKENMQKSLCVVPCLLPRREN